MRRRAALLLAVTAACGSSAVTVDASAPMSLRPYRDLPDVPQRAAPVELSSQYELPAPLARPAPQRAARSSTRPRTATAAASSAPMAVSGDVWAALARCESGMRQNAISYARGGPYLSYFQWLLATWQSVGGVGDPRTVDYDTQVRLAQRLQARSGWGQWPRCSRKLGLS